MLATTHGNAVIFDGVEFIREARRPSSSRPAPTLPPPLHVLAGGRNRADELGSAAARHALALVGDRSGGQLGYRSCHARFGLQPARPLRSARELRSPRDRLRRRLRAPPWLEGSDRVLEGRLDSSKAGGVRRPARGRARGRPAPSPSQGRREPRPGARPVRSACPPPLRRRERPHRAHR